MPQEAERTSPQPMDTPPEELPALESTHGEEAGPRDRLVDGLFRVSRAVTTDLEPPALLQRICRILVDTTDLALVWAAHCADDGMLEPPLAHAGRAEAFLQAWERYGIGAADPSPEAPPPAIALRTGRPSIRQQRPEGAADPFWQHVEAHGLDACMALPIEMPETPSCILVLHADRPEAFDDALIELCGTVSAMLRQALSARELQKARDRARQEERRAAEQQQILWDYAPIGIFRSSLDGRIFAVNAAYARIFGYDSPEEMVRCIRDVAMDVYVEPGRREEVVRRLMASRGPRRFENRYRRKDGAEFRGELIAEVVRDEAGTPLYLYGYVEDVTERRRTEERIRESESRYRILSELITDFVYGANVRTGEPPLYDWVVGAAERISGYTVEEIRSLPRRWHDVIHPDDLPAVRARRADLVANRPVVYEYRIVTKAGEIRWMRDYVRPVWSEEAAAVTRILGAVQDITDQKRSEEALRQNEEQYRSIFNSTTDALIVFGRRGEILEVNPAACEVYGYPRGEFIGLTVSDIIHADYLYKLDEFVRCVEDGKDFVIESLNIRKDGTPFYVEVRGARSVFQGEEALLAVVRDVTESRLTERRLRKGEEKHRALTENSPDLIVRFDRRYVVLHANRRMAEWRGVSAEDCYLKSFRTLAFPEEECRWWEERLEWVFSRDRMHIDLRETREQDSPFVCEWRFVPEHGPGGMVESVLCIGRDITAQRRAEEQLRQSQKMEAIGQLAGGIAHDFNNQLAGIMGYAEMLNVRLDHDEHLGPYAEKVLQASRRAADLTTKLLTFARKGHYQRVPVDLHEVIGEVMDFLRHSVDKRVRIESVLAAGEHVVQGEPTQLQSALLNIGINARDAMPEGGYLLYATEITELTEAECGRLPFELQPGRFLVTRIRDTGVGMSPEMMEHIFEPFYTTKQKGEGTGMGLASVYGTVKAHLGAILVDSEPGRGTEFRIFLPLATEQTAEEPGTSSAPAVRGSARIMLVDDEEVVREMTADMLRELGYEVIAFGSGQEAVAYYETAWREVDLVILDMVMPGLNGRATFHGLRQINRDVRAVLSSGYSVNGEAQAVLDEGALAFIQKPYQIGQLSQQVADVLG